MICQYCCFFRVQGDGGQGPFVGALHHFSVKVSGDAAFLEEAAFGHQVVFLQGLHGGHHIIYGVQGEILEVDGGLLFCALGAEVLEVLVEVLDVLVQVVHLIGKLSHLVLAGLKFAFQRSDVVVFFVEFLLDT